MVTTIIKPIEKDNIKKNDEILVKLREHLLNKIQIVTNRKTKRYNASPKNPK